MLMQAESGASIKFQIYCRKATKSGLVFERNLRAALQGLTMAESYDLTKLDSNSFEHMANLIAMRVLGSGHTGFGPGPDGGRDGLFEGEASYPSDVGRWSGRWYVQSKFHKPHLSKDPQKWIVQQIEEEVKQFQDPKTKRRWPDNWIIVTNIDPSGAPSTGAFDRAKSIVAAARPELENHFHIWGGRKVLDFLARFPDISSYYAHFLTPGHVLTAFYQQIKDAQAEISSILRFLIVRQFSEQRYTKLEQAGSRADTRPGIHKLFTDLPFECPQYKLNGLVAHYLARTIAQNHCVDTTIPDTPEWRLWRRHPSRARVWFIKGGPGQGKSTISQYVSQLQRAAVILQDNGFTITPEQKALAIEIKENRLAQEFWPTVPRIPISLELKEFAQWFGRQTKDHPRGVLTYLTAYITSRVEERVYPGTLKRAFGMGSWLIIFDGLDEVPSDVKDEVALQVRSFVDDVLLESNADALVLCTSRPQGYSGQFSQLDGPELDLSPLSPEQALACAKPVLEIDRTNEEAARYYTTLAQSTKSGSIRELMTTPLQAHIMAVVVRDGAKPPERRWQLFNNFYQVIKKREGDRDLADPDLARLLRE